MYLFKPLFLHYTNKGFYVNNRERLPDFTVRFGADMAKTSKQFFSKELVDFITEWKKKRGNLIMILHRVQEEYGYISKEAAREVANMTGVPLAQICGVISFYHFFKTQKSGKNNVKVCLGTACYLKGSGSILAEFRKQLKLADGEEITSDGEFSVEAVRCIGCCGLAPVISVNGEVFGKAETSHVAGIISKYGKKADA